MIRAAALLVLAVLAGCGAEGDPIRPAPPSVAKGF
jgi:predicted small lipoprotein YifL